MGMPNYSGAAARKSGCATAAPAARTPTSAQPWAPDEGLRRSRRRGRRAGVLALVARNHTYATIKGDSRLPATHILNGTLLVTRFTDLDGMCGNLGKTLREEVKWLLRLRDGHNEPCPEVAGGPTNMTDGIQLAVPDATDTVLGIGERTGGTASYKGATLEFTIRNLPRADLYRLRQAAADLLATRSPISTRRTGRCTPPSADPPAN